MGKSSRIAMQKPTGADGLAPFLATLDHPLNAEIRSLCRVILEAAPGISGAVKWNAPSFRTTEFFATVHLRSRAELQLILHRGAKARPPAEAPAIADPNGLIRWLAADRCLVSLGAGKVFASRRVELTRLVRAWLGRA